MKSELSCPVCSYTEITGNSCPNCDTDLSLIRLLTQLPSNSQVTELEKPQRQPKFAGWQVGFALLILMIGIGLGTMGSFFLQPQLISKTDNSSSPTTVSGNNKIPPTAQAPVKPQQPTQYTVKPKDNLSVITEKFCGKGKSWQVMVKANPQLKGRENWITVGEVLKLPNCEG